ncbi:MAG: hypothetical protein WCW31_01520 [Patescibacteria group bacterium]
MNFPLLRLQRLPFEPMVWTWYGLLGVSVAIFIGFWIWALVHAARTPRATWTQKLLWSLCLFINPMATVWYWCVWKRWAFWFMFTPMLGIFVALPLVVRSLMTSAEATNVNDYLFAFGSNTLVIFFAILLIFPIVLRLIVTLNLTVNGEVTALDRNDWVLSIAFPIIGYGAALVYAIKHLKAWAFASIAWVIVIAAVGQAMVANVSPLLIPAGQEKREEFKLRRAVPVLPIR